MKTLLGHTWHIKVLASFSETENAYGSQLYSIVTKTKGTADIDEKRELTFIALRFALLCYKLHHGTSKQT